MAVPANSLWFLVTGSVPTNWTAQTSFNDKYLNGDQSNFDGTAEENTAGHLHIEIADGHLHVLDAHTHSVSGASATGTSAFNALNGGLLLTSKPVQPVHTHPAANSAAFTTPYDKTIITTLGTAFVGAHARVIVIKPDDGNQLCPIDIMAFTDKTTAPTNFHITDGNDSTVTLQDKLIRGGATIDLNVSGTTNHLHNQSHTHTSGNISNNVHAHASGAMGTGVPNDPSVAAGGVTMLDEDHHFTASSGTTDTPGTNTDQVSSEDAPPPAVALLAVQNNSGGTVEPPTDIVCGFDAAVSTIDAGWELADGRNGGVDTRGRFIIGTTTGGTVGTFSGSICHQHTLAHVHIHSSHTHTSNRESVLGANPHNIVTGKGGGTIHPDEVGPPPTVHAHVWTFVSATQTVQSTTAILGGADGRPQFRTLLFIKKVVDNTTVKILGNTTILGSTTVAA